MDGVPHWGVVMENCMFMILATWGFHGSPNGRTCRRRLQVLLEVDRLMEWETWEEMLGGLLLDDEILEYG